MKFVCSKCKREVETPGVFCPFCGTSAPPPETEASDPLIGRTIANKYFVNQRVGRGGMGQVYRGTDVILDRPVALKMLDRTLLSDPSMIQRFHREGRAASRLNHPNCITILEFGQTEDHGLFIAMEYLAGRSLSRLLSEEGPLDQGRVVRVVSQILSALAEAHAAGVIHRDLKLSNLMIESRRDEPDFVKVLDFGIAKLAEPGEGAAQLTGTGIVCGTPGYMSPEQARGEELDARSDLYAVGVILYELLSGRLPFESATPMGFVTKHMTEAPIPLRERRPDLDIAPDLEALTARALAKARADRPSSAAAMREELLACRIPAVAPERRATPRPAPSATVMLPSSRPDSTPPRGPAPARATSSDAPKATPSPGSRLATPEPDLARPRTPTPASSKPGGPSEEDSEPFARRPSWETPAVTEPPEPAAPKSRPDPRAAPRQSGAALRRARRLQGRPLWATVGAGCLVIVLVVWGLMRSDPFAAPPPPPPEADAGLKLGGSRPARTAMPAAAPEAGVGAPAEEPGSPPQPVVPPAPQPVVASAPQLEIVRAPQPVALPPPQPAVVSPSPPVRPERAPSRIGTAPGHKKGSGVVEDAEGLNVIKIPEATTGHGVLAVTASPWGVVSIDGRELGETPREFRLGEGYYRLRVAHPTLGAQERVVVVTAGRRRTVNIPLSGGGPR